MTAFVPPVSLATILWAFDGCFGPSVAVAARTVWHFDLFAGAPAAGTLGPDPALDAIDEALVVVDRHERVLRINEAARAAFGITPEAVVGSPFSAVLGADLELTENESRGAVVSVSLPTPPEKAGPNEQAEAGDEGLPAPAVQDRGRGVDIGGGRKPCQRNRASLVRCSGQGGLWELGREGGDPSNVGRQRNPYHRVCVSTQCRDRRVAWYPSGLGCP